MLLAVSTVYLFGTLLCSSVSSTPLDDYVAKPDPHYGYTVVNWTFEAPGYKLHVLNMTSQKWLTENEVDHPIWYHYIVVAIPDELTNPDIGFLYIALGSNSPTFNRKIDDEFISFISMMSASTGSVCAVIFQIPNQPLVFKNDPSQKSRKEDAVIAWTWRTFMLNPNDPEWLLRLPMTKAVVRAMDTVTEFAHNTKPASQIERFFVCGESKRGWTTWTTAAVDKRVVGISPIVMDLLNTVENLHHHFRSLGGWTFAFNDYYEVNITSQLDSPNTQAMLDIVDPYAYRDRLTMPKYIVTTGGDEFFIPDDSYYYFDDLPGEKYLRKIPNAEHSLTFHRISLFFGMRAFYLSVIEGLTRPNVTWERTVTSDGGKITLHTDRIPATVRGWQATTLDGDRRDFRLAAADPNNPSSPMPHPVIWHHLEVSTLSDHKYEASVKNPEVGWRAFFIQVSYEGPQESAFEFTSQTQIVPDTFPFPDCHGEGCYGKLV